LERRQLRDYFPKSALESIRIDRCLAYRRNPQTVAKIINRFHHVGPIGLSSDAVDNCSVDHILGIGLESGTPVSPVPLRSLGQGKVSRADHIAKVEMTRKFPGSPPLQQAAEKLSPE
jgi:hypothetical protein